MNCNGCRERMMDVLYGEDLSAGDSFEFFEHLDDCRGCRREYLDFLETRSQLTEWKEPENPQPTQLPAAGFAGAAGWNLRGWSLGRPWRHLQTAAAIFLVLVGSLSVLQSMGLWNSPRMMVSKEQLLETVNDMIVIRQAEERKIIGQAMVNFADQMMLDQKNAMRSMADQFQVLERRYLDNLELNNEHLQTLIKRSE